MSGHGPQNERDDWLWSDLEISGATHFAGFDDSDTPSEVDAAFRTQRRIALWHFAIFVIVLVGSVAVTTIGSWAVTSQVGGGMNFAFALCGIVLFALFVAIGLAAATLADGVDDRMLGADSLGHQDVSP